MPIKMTASLAGEGFSLAPGDRPTHFTAKEEARLIAAGLAVADEDAAAASEGAALADQVAQLRATEAQLRATIDNQAKQNWQFQQDVKEKDALISDLRTENQRLAEKVAELEKPAPAADPSGDEQEPAPATKKKAG